MEYCLYYQMCEVTDTYTVHMVGVGIVDNEVLGKLNAKIKSTATSTLLAMTIQHTGADNTTY